MSLLTAYSEEIPIKAFELSDWLLAHGISAVTTAEAAYLMGVSASRVRQLLATPRSKGRFVSPSRGLWVPVSPENSMWGAPEPAAYLDALMEHLRARYYVGWLSAASLHGASHQAPQVFQVAVSRRVEDRRVGRNRLHFLVRSALGALPALRVATSSGIVTVSSPGATMLDIMDDIDEAGGLDNAVTVVAELASENADYLADILLAAPFHSDSAVRRLGWVLEEVAGVRGLGELKHAAAGKASNPSLLSPHSPRTSNINHRWMINVNATVDPDL